ncbi:MAG: PAQR family membrane homeostasis protein TrhA [Pseudobdellovibrio sp.]
MYKGERFNSFSHLLGFIFALISSIILLDITLSKHEHDALRIISFSIYGAMIVTLYLASTIYHSVRGKKKDFFRLIDYLSIYLMIAGSYTPFALIVLGGTWGWSIFAAIWVLALIGITQEILIGKKTRKYSLFIYVVMGWLILVAIKPFINSLPERGVWWIVTCGMCYTFGIFFFLLDEKYKHFHGIWHVCVLLGSVCQFICLYNYVV